MIYTIRVNAEGFYEGFRKAEVQNVDENKRTSVVGFFENRAMPDTETVIRVSKNQFNKPVINISNENLQLAVRSFALTDEKERKPITTADPNFAMDPFWTNKSLALEIPNVGHEIECKGFDETPINNFWLSVAEADDRFFIDDGQHDRPENMTNVMFILTPKYLEVDRKVMDGIKGPATKMADVYEITRILFSMDRERKMILLESSKIAFDEKMNDSDLDKLIIDALESPEKNHINGQRFDDFFMDVAKMSAGSVETMKAAKFMIKNNIVVLKGDQYYFEDNQVGFNEADIAKQLSKAANAKLYKAVVKACKEAGM